MYNTLHIKIVAYYNVHFDHFIMITFASSVPSANFRSSTLTVHQWTLAGFFFSITVVCTVCRVIINWNMSISFQSWMHTCTNIIRFKVAKFFNYCSRLRFKHLKTSYFPGQLSISKMPLPSGKGPSASQRSLWFIPWLQEIRLLHNELSEPWILSS